MHICLGNNSQILVSRLHKLMATPMHHVDVERLRHVSSSIPVFAETDCLPVTSPLYTYSLFPPRIMRHLTQWAYENRPMQLGDTIVQQIWLPPVAGGLVSIICGVRITNIFRQQDRVGFSYTTLAGHVEQGISTFSLQGLGPHALFKIDTLSRPALPGGKLLAPLFANPYQAWCTRQALAHVRAQLAAT